MRPSLAVLLIVLGLTAAAFWEVTTAQFVAYDDPLVLTDEPMVNQGLRSAAVLWAFTAPHNANWQPLTTITHLIDCTLFDLEPAMHHRVNLAWHLLNTALVFLLWHQLTRTLWPSAFVAALFGWHPLHVESVAWISQRKDLVSTALWLLALLAYLRHTRRPARGTFALVAICTALGLMAKPMVVTLPFTLLLLDFWPLRRWPARSWLFLVREKALLFALSAVTSVLTIVFQRSAGALDTGDTIPLAARLANAAVSYARYLGKFLWPVPLSPFYPHPGTWPGLTVAGAVLLLALVTAWAWRQRTRQPWFLFGWLWFLGTLVPTIGILQTGAHSLADRYTYVSMLGLLTVLAGAAAALLGHRTALRWPLAAAAGVVLTACFFQTRLQTRIWRDGITLATHMRSVVGEHPTVLQNLAMAYELGGRPGAEILAVVARGHALYPANPFFRLELAKAAAARGQLQQALADMQALLAEFPDAPRSHHEIGYLLLRAGRLAEAELHFRRVIALHPASPIGHRFLGTTLERQGRLREAATALQRSVDLAYWDWAGRFELGVVLYKLGRTSDALVAFEKAHWINPGDRMITENLSHLRRQLSPGRTDTPIQPRG